MWIKRKENFKIGNIHNTDEWFKEKVNKYHGRKVEILSKYCGSDKPIDFVYHCNKHGDTYATVNAKNICKEYFLPCKDCQSIRKSKSAKGTKKKDKQYYYDRISNYCKERGGYIVTPEWTRAKDEYEFKCGDPTHPIFKTTADALYSGAHWCPYCSGRSGNFNDEIKAIVESKGGTLLSEYINAYEHVKVRCNKHNYSWNIMPLNIRKGRWCPVCSMCYSEKVVFDYLKHNFINFEIQYGFSELQGKNGELLKFDFALFDSSNNLRWLLEVDDVEHTYNYKSERRLKARERDEQKNNYCKSNNINLYRMEVPFKSGYKHHWAYEDYYRYINTELKSIVNEIKMNK